VIFVVLADTKDHDNGRPCHAETPQQQQNLTNARPATLKIKLNGVGVRAKVHRRVQPNVHSLEATVIDASAAPAGPRPAVAARRTRLPPRAGRYAE
jgi:hypothetical protein